MFRYCGKWRHTCNTDTKRFPKWKIKVQRRYSVPCNESVIKAKKRLQKDIEDGKYCLGKAIVPEEHKKYKEYKKISYWRNIYDLWTKNSIDQNT